MGTVQTGMRWKLLILTCLLGAFVGGAWCLLTIVAFGQLGIFSNPLIALSSLLIPLLLSAFAAFFVYRHTARRRKTQALITMVLTLLLTLCVDVTIMRLYQR
jgi:ABC-type glycerol-3-phosphate transport system permease component